MTDEELKRLLDTHIAESRRHFDEAANRLSAENRHFFQTTAEALRADIQLVAEGVADTRDLVARADADIRAQLTQSTSETQAMIKFSHADLDRRMTAMEQTQSRLEEAITDLQARVGRLEGSPH